MAQLKKDVAPEAADAHRVESFEEDPISFLCSVLSDESASVKHRRAAALELLPYYHPVLARMGPLLKRFAN